MEQLRTKNDLLHEIQRQRAAWEDLLREVGESRMEQPGAMGSWTFKDLAAHLAGWRRLSISRLEAAGRGETPPPPSWPADLETDDDINEAIHAANRDRPLADVLREFHDTYGQLEAAVVALSERQLTAPALFPWMETQPLAEIVRGALGHYHDEHEAAVRAWLAGADLQLITLDDIVTLKTVSQVALSPDGETVAYVLSTASKEGVQPSGQIYLISATGEGATPRQFTAATGMHGSPRWSPDCRGLAFTSDREQEGIHQLYVIPLAGGEARRLTKEPGGVGDPRWSPDGTTLSYTVTAPPDPDEGRKKQERDDVWVASQSWKRQRLWLIGREGAECRPLSPLDSHIWTHEWSPDGTHVAAIVSATPEWNEVFGAQRLVIYTVAGDARDADVRDLGPAPLCDRLVWSADGHTLYGLSALAEQFPETYLCSWSADGAAGSAPRQLLGDLPATPMWLCRPQSTADVFVLAWQGVHTLLYRLDPATGSTTSLLATSDSARGSISQVSFSADGRRVAMVRSDGAHPDDLWVWDASTGLRQLTDVNPWLRDRTLGRQEEISWSSFDGQHIGGLLIYPPRYEPGQLYPLVVNVHGGPTWLWTDHCHINWHDWGQWLAAQGFLVLLPNPRGSAGRGNAFARANVGDIGGGDYRDMMAGVDHLIQAGLADGARLGIGGWSYGGTLTPWTITQTERFRCAVMGAGICNWVSFAGTCDIRIFADRLLDATLHQDATALWEQSALRHVSRVRTPTLIVHGQADVRVPVSQGHEFYSALRHIDVPTELVTYPRGGHQISERLHQRDLLTRIADWFIRYLKD